jgi:ABC-type uncharacterized transport system permease subunit
VRVTTSIFLTLAAVLRAWLFLRHSFLGFKMAVGGAAPAAAGYAGFSAAQSVWLGLLAGGAAAGLAGMMEAAGPLAQLSPNISPGYGFAAIIVAFTGRLSAFGYRVIAIRYLTTLFGGAMAGLGGAYLALAYTPLWVENMTAGRGWIALVLVVFAGWRPLWVLLGALLFGGVDILQLHAQGFGLAVPPELLSSLPYAVPILVLVIISRDRQTQRLSFPLSLAKPFRVDD